MRTFAYTVVIVPWLKSTYKASDINSGEVVYPNSQALHKVKQNKFKQSLYNTGLASSTF